MILACGTSSCHDYYLYYNFKSHHAGQRYGQDTYMPSQLLTHKVYVSSMTITFEPGKWFLHLFEILSCHGNH